MPRKAKLFWDRVDKSGDCWLWVGHRNEQGYGTLRFHGRMEKAHRVAWILAHGEIPEGKQVLHHCDNPPCVRHLFIGTNHINVLDRHAKGRSRNLFTSENHPRKVLQSADIKAIRFLRRNGLKQREIAAQFGVSRGHIAQLTRPYLMEQKCQS